MKGIKGELNHSVTQFRHAQNLSSGVSFLDDTRSQML